MLAWGLRDPHLDGFTLPVTDQGLLAISEDHAQVASVAEIHSFPTFSHVLGGVSQSISGQEAFGDHLRHAGMEHLSS